jgi:hypothetical protein
MKKYLLLSLLIVPVDSFSQDFYINQKTEDVYEKFLDEQRLDEKGLKDRIAKERIK